MGIVHVLSSETINQIAAGEVIERPASVVKELVENAVDSGATRVTVEIEDGGTKLIRVSDNGSGFASEDIRTAFLRHATSKISCGDDLYRIHSLGFRGEALSSIAAVSRVELLTYNEEDYLGSRYVIEGGEEVLLEEAGCPTGTTILIRDLFFNVPARRKFLKSVTTEAGYCNEWISRFSIAHPEVSITMISNGRTLLHTSGNGRLKDAIYAVYGREIAEHLLPVEYEGTGLKIGGCIGETVITKSNRSGELCFVNGRDIKSKVVSQAVEEAFRTYVMQHKYPFTALFLTVRPDILDVNIHPTKSDVRFSDSEEVSHAVYTAVRTALKNANLIRMVDLPQEKDSGESEGSEADASEKKVAEHKPPRPAENFETCRIASELLAEAESGENGSRGVSQEPSYPELAAQAFAAAQQYTAEPGVLEQYRSQTPVEESGAAGEAMPQEDSGMTPGVGPMNGTNPAIGGGVASAQAGNAVSGQGLVSSGLSEIPDATAPGSGATGPEPEKVVYEQLSFLDPTTPKEYRIIGQVFNTYWILEMNHQMLMIDQHAAHERVNYERLLAHISAEEEFTQQVSPPEILHLPIREEEVLLENRDWFAKLGFDIRELGGREYGVCGVPMVLLGIAPKDYIAETLDRLAENRRNEDPLLLVAEKVASMSCKAAIKGGQEISRREVEHLLDELMTLENPYHCPHGRPIIISMTKYDIEKRFKRIV